MSIGFSFTGVVKKPETLVQTANELAEVKGYRIWTEGNRFRLALCPMGGDLYVSWKIKSTLLGSYFSQYTVEGSCRSTPAGPGFHVAAVEVLDALGLRNLKVKDDTGYYRHRDFGRMCAEHFHPWLNKIVSVCEQKRDELKNMAVAWDMDQYIPENIPGTVISSMGRFSVRWMRETLAEKGPEALAQRFYLWYHPGAPDALYRRNLGLNLLWESCFFAPSSRSKEDAGINEAICENIEMAARLDPTLPLPRKAYQEVCSLAGKIPALPDGPEMELEFEPGFRKGFVTYAIGPLRLTLPGIYQFEWEKWDENSGCHIWWESDDGPVWRANGFRLQQGNAAFSAVNERYSDVTEQEIAGGSARWGWRQVDEDGEPYYHVLAEVISGPSRFLITVSYHQPEERPGIEDLIKKITVSRQDLEKHLLSAN